MYVNPAIPRMRIRPTLTVIPFLCHFALFASLNIFERYVSLVFHYWAAPFRARPVINLVFGRLCRKTVFRGREGTRVWYRETMFSQVVSHDFPLQGPLHEYFLYLASASPETQKALRSNKPICVVRSDSIIGVTL